MHSIWDSSLSGVPFCDAIYNQNGKSILTWSLQRHYSFTPQIQSCSTGKTFKCKVLIFFWCLNFASFAFLFMTDNECKLYIKSFW